MARLIDADALSRNFCPGETYRAGEIQDVIDAAPTVELVGNPDRLNGWISVEDRLPMLIESVLFTGKNAHGSPFLTQRGYFDGTFWHSDSIGTVYATTPVTHWMPLPEPPEEVTA